MIDPIMRASAVFLTIWNYLPVSIQSLFGLSVILFFLAFFFRIFH